MYSTAASLIPSSVKVVKLPEDEESDVWFDVSGFPVSDGFFEGCSLPELSETGGVSAGKGGLKRVQLIPPIIMTTARTVVPNMNILLGKGILHTKYTDSV